MKKIAILMLFLACIPIWAMAQSTTETYNMMRAIEAARSGDNETAIDFLSKELDVNPKNGYAHMWTALVCAQSDRYGWALQYAESAIKYLPKSAKDGRCNMNILLSEIYTDAKDTTRAVACLEQALKEQPKIAHTYKVLIRLSKKRGDKDGMMRYAQMALKNLPKDMEAQLFMADALAEDKRFGEAVAYCDKALTMTEPQSKERSRVLTNRASLKAENQQPSEALADLMAATRIDIWDASEDILEKLEDTIPDEVRDTLLAAIEQEPDKLFWKIFLYDYYRHNNEYSKAVQMGFSILPQYSSEHIVHYIASMVEFHIGDTELAEKMLLKQLQVDSTSAATYVRLEELYAETGRYHEAFAMAEKALAFNPTPSDKASAYQLRGRIYEIQHEYRKAIDDFMAGMIADPRDYGYWFRIGKLYGAMNEPEKQADAFEQGRKAYAAHGAELSAEAHVVLGDSAKAFELAQKMIKKENSAEDHYNAACVYAQIGHPEEALEHLRKAIEYGFRHFYHIAWDMDLDSLRGRKEFEDMVSEYKQIAEQEKQALRSTIDTELKY